MDEIKKALPRDSSALVLIADTQTCDAMVKMFEAPIDGPTVVRRDVAEELRRRLEALHRMSAQQLADVGQAEAEGASAPH
jgi:hypothetical protein